LTLKHLNLFHAELATLMIIIVTSHASHDRLKLLCISKCMYT